MDIKRPALSTFTSLLRSARRDPGISLRRANRHWFLALMASVVVTFAAGMVAYYEFIATQTEDVILTDPVQTARYRAENVQTALERYDSRREGYVIGESKIPSRVQNSGANAPSVDTEAGIRVE
jgi:hypothetical protein